MVDQLEILDLTERLLVQQEKQIDQHYNRLEQQMLAILSEAFEKGDTLAEQQRYNRLESLRNSIDSAATETYSQIANEAPVTTEDTFNEVYLLYAYLLYMFFSDEEGEPLNLPSSSVVKASIYAAIIYALLKQRKNLLEELKRFDDSLVVFTKYKNDLVYSLYMDVYDNLRTEKGLPDAKKRVKARIESARTRSTLALRHYWDAAYNFAVDSVYSITKKHIDVKKMWLSMKDHRVRLAHRILDGQIAKDGWFHYQGDKARRPKGFTNMELNYGCRCKVFLLINGKLPQTSKIYDYSDAMYQRKLNKRIAELVSEDKTSLQAYLQARNEIRAPKRKVKGYIIYEDWYEKYGPGRRKGA